MTFGPNMAAESVQLFANYEKHMHEIGALRADAIAQLTEEMNDLQEFLNLLADGTKEFNKDDPSHIIDFTKKKELIKRLSHNPQLRHLFPDGKYKWEDIEIPAAAKEIGKKIKEWEGDDNLKRQIHQRMEGFLPREIQRKYDEAMFDQQELAKAADLFNRGLHRMFGLIDTIQRNIQRVH